MHHKKVDRTLKNIRLAKTLIAQTRPIIPRSVKAFKINTSMKTSPFWGNQHEIALK